jgi:hypothetical protein
LGKPALLVAPLAPHPLRCVTPCVPPLRRFFSCVFVAATLVLAGCSSVETRKVLDLAPFKRLYVERQLSDDRRIDEQIVQELRRLGYDASCGHLTMMPEKIDAVVTYDARWEWDFKTYLIELNVTVRTARTAKKLADGRYYQPTPVSKPPADVIREVLAPLFKK